ncbi:MAG: hypothetical protein GDA46_06055 [Bdellovibrionales bacterium]|nr:hypothetical protein [Bdellovibrionales bacterium]
MFVLEVVEALDKYKVKYALIGAYALAFHGIVRATMDVDIAISLTSQELKNTEKALQSINLTSRLPLNAKELAMFRKDYIKKRNLIAWSFIDFKDRSRGVDVLLTDSLKKFSVEQFIFKKNQITVLSLKDLLYLKQKSKRLKDQLDVQSIEELLNEKKD